jgi:hypothetical protein
MLLAVGSFVPGLGFLLGSAAVSWGLVTDRPRARLAILVGGAGAFCQVLGAIVLILMTQDNPSIRQMRLEETSHDLFRVVIELDAYRDREGAYPPTLRDLIGRPIPRVFVNINDQAPGIFKQHPFQYHTSRNFQSFDLFSVGFDGKPNTEDDIRPQLPDSLQASTGYRPQP